MTKAEAARRKLGIEVRRVGSIEVVRKSRHHNGVGRYVHVDGYSVVVDGDVTYPWMQKRQALAEAAELAAKRSSAMNRTSARVISRQFEDVNRQMRRYLRSRGLTMREPPLPIGNGEWKVYVHGQREPLIVRDEMVRGS